MLGLAALAARPMALGQDPDPDESRLVSNLLTRMSLPVSVNGRRGPVFVIDTGAGRTVLSTELAAAMGLPHGPEILVHGITAAQIAPTARIARLGVAGRGFTDVTAPVFPRAVLGADGLLGLDVLGRFSLKLNLGRREIAMSPSGYEAIQTGPAGGMASRLTTRTRPALTGRFGQLILAGATVDGAQTRAFVDTGAQRSIGNLALLSALGGDRSSVERIEILGVTGQMQAVATGQVADLRIGGHRLGATPLLFADLHAFRVLDLIERPALLIGADLLFRFREVTLDFGRSRMAFRGLRPATG